MFGWLRRNRADDPGETGGFVPDRAPTPEERRDELLYAYLDDDLAAPERQELETRLETDPALREALEGMRVVRDTLATLEVVRAPRSFAIPATAPAAPRRFSPLDLASRVGAMAAAVAFVVVLAGDLSENGGPTVQQDSATTEFSAAAPDVGAGDDSEAAGDDGANAAGAAASAPGAAPVTDEANQEAATAVAVDDDPASAATPEAPVLDPNATVQASATATSAERSATEESGDAGTAADTSQVPDSAASAGSDGEASADAAPTLPPNTGGAIEPPADATPDPAVEEDGTPSEDPETSALALPQPDPEDADTARVDDGGAPGTLPADAALGTQPEGLSSTAATAEGANGLASDGREVSGLAIGLGSAAAVLAVVSGWLWWRRREGTVGPV